MKQLRGEVFIKDHLAINFINLSMLPAATKAAGRYHDMDGPGHLLPIKTRVDIIGSLFGNSNPEL